MPIIRQAASLPWTEDLPEVRSDGLSPDIRANSCQLATIDGEQLPRQQLLPQLHARC